MNADGSRRDRLADAAIETLAREGTRGLTHRAVDREAGLPEGSCSYYFRTRQALLQAVIERLEAVDAAEMAAPLAAAGGADDADVVESVARLVERWTTTGRSRMLARYELALEANRRPEVRAVFVRAGRRSRAMTEAMLTAAGAPDPGAQAPLLVAYLDGLIFDHLAGAGALDLDPAGLRAALAHLLHAFRDPAGWAGHR
ncbi:TetR/AcrR family transcriptional regulator [Actinomadura kijaniata]|uniref:TetR/AcrR family transcriptional regulator n=1 Tax=Actinomadura kijaniata TaxID=46161 RepID=UPI00082A7F49|nr:TetR/AcrR family transcriptional regulator [Actinomadura kijaniata]